MMNSFAPVPRRLILPIRVVGVTIGTMVLAIILPIAADYLAFIVESNVIMQSDAFLPNSASIFALRNFADFFCIDIMPMLLGATFWWSTWRLRKTNYSRVSAESILLALTFTI